MLAALMDFVKYQELPGEHALDTITKFNWY